MEKFSPRKKWWQLLDGTIVTAFVAASAASLWIPHQFATDPMTKFTVAFATADYGKYFFFFFFHRQKSQASIPQVPKLISKICWNTQKIIFLFSGSSKPRFLDGAQLETWTVQAGEDESNACPRCNGKVFEAEKMISMRHVYHKKCFTCKECSRPMDQFIACDAPDGKIL